MLELLRKREMATSELVQPFGMSQPTISEHLRALRVAGLISYRTRKNQHVYALVPSRLRAVREWIIAFDRRA